MRVETLYKTKTPEKEKSECYELVINHVPGVAPRIHGFLEMHGWWDEASKTYVLSRTTINTKEEPLTLEEAEKMLNDAKSYLARNGFVHSFSPDPFSDNPHHYELIQT